MRNAILSGIAPDNLTVGGGLYLNGCTLANVYRAGRDRRGYEFFGARLANGWRVLAGCRNFSADEARAHWHKGSECRALAEAVIAAELVVRGQERDAA